MDNPLAQSIIKGHARCYDTSYTEFIHLYYKSIILQINNSDVSHTIVLPSPI